MTLADFLIVLVVVASTAIGFFRGFIREAVALVFWVASIWAAWQFGPLVEPHLGGLLAGGAVRPWVARIIVLIGLVVIGALIGTLLQYVLRGLGFGLLDRLIGLMFGFMRGLVLVGLAVIGGELLHLNAESWWDESRLIPYGETVGDWLRAMVGEHGDPWSRLERLTGVKVR